MRSRIPRPSGAGHGHETRLPRNPRRTYCVETCHGPGLFFGPQLPVDGASQVLVSALFSSASRPCDPVNKLQFAPQMPIMETSPQPLRWLGARPASAGLCLFGGVYQTPGFPNEPFASESVAGS
jgi:hypothetical protein